MSKKQFKRDRISQLEKIVDKGMRRIENLKSKPVSLEKAKKILAEKYGGFDRRKPYEWYI